MVCTGYPSSPTKHFPLGHHNLEWRNYQSMSHVNKMNVVKFVRKINISIYLIPETMPTKSNQYFLSERLFSPTLIGCCWINRQNLHVIGYFKKNIQDQGRLTEQLLEQAVSAEIIKISAVCNIMQKLNHEFK
jgi:hypothetical protein